MALQSTTAIATITLQQASSEVVFSGIPATYRDLIVVFNGNSSASSGFANLYFNNDKTGANYSNVYAYGNASEGAASTSYSGAPLGPFAWWARSETGMAIAQIMDYSATDKHKTPLIRFDNKGMDMTMMKAMRWSSTAAITSVYITATSSTFAIGSTFSLYGRVA